MVVNSKRPSSAVGTRPWPKKLGIHRFLLGIFWMRILAMRVGLPDFQQSVGDGRLVAVEHLAGNDHALSGSVRASYVSDVPRFHADTEKRSDRLPWAGGKFHAAASGELLMVKIFQRGGLAAAQNDIETVTQRLSRESGFPIEL